MRNIPISTASRMSRKSALGTDNGQRHIRLDSCLNVECCETHSRPYCAVGHDSDEDMLSVKTGQYKRRDLMSDTGDSV